MKEPENEYVPFNLDYKGNILDRWFPNGVADYGANYALTHPWVILKYWRRHVKYALQRVFRGWDDRVIWSINDYLARMIPVWVKELKRKSHGIPCVFFDDEDWDEQKSEYKNGSEKRAEEKYHFALDQIVRGFEAYSKMQETYDKEELAMLNITYKLGFSYFQKYFNDLWD
jgi:hypothetical protein